MLFTDSTFLLIFLPLVLLGYWFLFRYGRQGWSANWLLVSSVVFYAFSGAGALGLFLGSLCVNYWMGKWMAEGKSRWRPTFGIGLNLALLVVYKYADFLLQNFSGATGVEVPLLHLELPLAISFYTFQQIVYLVQCWRTQRSEIHWRDYALAVSFFPHLMAGPLVHYRQLVPQFLSEERKAVALENFHRAIGLLIIALGKKLLIADTMAPISAQVFDAARDGAVVGALDAWRGTLAYAFQVYFDFSAYSEMALALALMFGIHLPVNFNRPYLAVNVRDFWKRWHISLSEFLRDYVYIPLGGSRCGSVQRWVNLFLTMLLGGIWHGAGWNFLVWGGLHGLLLVVNHWWAAKAPFRIPRAAGWAMTFFAVVMLWVPFRADTWAATATLWNAMLGGVVAPEAGPAVTGDSPIGESLRMVAESAGSQWRWFWEKLAGRDVRQWICVLLVGVVVVAGRSNLSMSADARSRTVWRALWLGLLLFLIVAKSFTSTESEFIYFRF